MIFSGGNLIWTQHSLAKLRQYRLSASRVLRILRYPKRKEIGVVEDTVASMQPAGSKKHPYEIWVMYQQKRKTQRSKLKTDGKITIISTWRYPGISPIHEPPPIPEDVLEIIEDLKNTHASKQNY